MAYDYNKIKQAYEGLNDEQRQQFEASNGNNQNYQQFKKEYAAEQAKNQTSNESNFSNQNGTNGGNFTNNQTNTRQLKGDNLNSNLTTEYVDDNGGWRSMNYDDRKKEYENMDEAGKKGYSNFLNSQSDDYWGRGFMDTYSEENGLDTSKFQQDPGKITVQEGTAQQTGRPDYQASSEARLNEMKGNLDHYFATSPRMFSDRDTFNRVFEYNTRESEAQRQLLDSYWKRKEDIDKASKYDTGDSISSGMKDADITPEQLNYIKDYSPEAYREWQQKQQDEINLRIANLATPADPTNNAELFNNLVNKLGLEPGDPYQIYDNWYSMCERLGVFSDSDKLKSYQDQLDQNHSKMESIMSRYSSSAGGTVSDALAAARMNKALAPYQQREVDLQNSYTTLLNGRNSNLAVANQSATALAMQAQEDQRVWNQRYQALGFAMSTASYRTPEQQAQLQLQTASIQNDLNLLNQSKQNDLALYNQKQLNQLNLEYQADLTRLQNKLNAELTDLSVEDEAQLKANLNNVLSDYYKNYGDIIQRSQPQAVEDIIAYAKKKGISVAQAMTENFIKPLQNKSEYKQKVATDYGMLSKQSIGTINGRSVIMTTNPNGSISYQYIDDDRTAIESTYKVGNTEYVKLYNGETMTAEEYNKRYGSTSGTAKPYDMVDSKVFDTTPASHSYYTLRDFIDDPTNKEGTYGGQCAKFVNDYLENIGVGRYFGNEDIKTRESWCNSDTAKVGTIAVFDYGHTSSDGINHGHVGIVVDADDKGFYVLDSNYDVNNPEKIKKRYIPYGSSSLKGFFDPSKPASAISTSETSTGGLTQSMIEDLAIDYLNEERSYSDIAKTYGDDVLKQVGLTASLLKDNGFERSKKITDPTQIFNSEMKLKTNFESINKGNKEALTQANKMQQALNKIDKSLGGKKLYNNASTQVIITAFNKLLDEDSVVRESEYARTPEGLSYIDRLEGKLNQIVNGGAGMTFDSLKSMVDLANEFATSYQNAQNEYANLTKNIADTYGLNTANILPLDVIQQLNNQGSIATGPTDPIQKNFEGLTNTTSSSVNTGVTASYMSSRVDFILNG